MIMTGYSGANIYLDDAVAVAIMLASQPSRTVARIEDVCQAIYQINCNAISDQTVEGLF